MPAAALSKLDEGGSLFTLSLNDESKELFNFMISLNKKTTIVSVTGLPNSTLAKMTDINIPFVTHKVFEYESRRNISPIS